jgi:hypothetical protein
MVRLIWRRKRAEPVEYVAPERTPVNARCCCLPEGELMEPDSPDTSIYTFLDRCRMRNKLADLLWDEFPELQNHYTRTYIAEHLPEWLIERLASPDTKA